MRAIALNEDNEDEDEEEKGGRKADKMSGTRKEPTQQSRCEKEGRREGTGEEEEEAPERPRPSAEQSFSDGEKGAGAAGECVHKSTGKGSGEGVGVRTVEGDGTGIAQMCVLNDGERVLT